ncbi:MAG: hypothetical protein AAFX78_13255 [Cyanobacteria bacterium J06638_20]
MDASILIMAPVVFQSNPQGLLRLGVTSEVVDRCVLSIYPTVTVI